MDTINISLPPQLKNQADTLIHRGYFASFSDLVRTALRKLISDSAYDLLVQEAIEEHKMRKATILTSPKEISAYIKRIAKS